MCLYKKDVAALLYLDLRTFDHSIEKMLGRKFIGKAFHQIGCPVKWSEDINIEDFENLLDECK